MRETVKLKTAHGSVLLEFTPDGIYIYGTCCGARLSRHKAKQLKRTLSAWLKGATG